MEYGNKEFKEDMQISKYIFYKHFRMQKNYKDDYLQTAIIWLYKARLQGKHEQFKFYIAKYAMIDIYTKLKKQTNNFDVVSLNTKIKKLKDSEQTIEDSLFCEIDFDKNIHYQQLVQTCVKIVNKTKNITIKKIIPLILDGKTNKEIAKILNQSRQNVNKYLIKFRQLLNEELTKQKTNIKG